MTNVIHGFTGQSVAPQRLLTLFLTKIEIRMRWVGWPHPQPIPGGRAGSLEQQIREPARDWFRPVARRHDCFDRFGPHDNAARSPPILAQDHLDSPEPTLRCASDLQTRLWNGLVVNPLPY